MKNHLDHELKKNYLALDEKVKLDTQDESSIRPELLMVFPYRYTQNNAEILIETEEFTALCPWTGLPDIGTLTIRYVPDQQCIELKSLKYYLLTYRQVAIVQEHAANRVLNDLVQSCHPKKMTIKLDYRVRGGLHTVVEVKYPIE